MKPQLSDYIHRLLPGMDRLTDSRIAVLQTLADYCVQKIRSEAELKLLFICTHNSRRSHFSQIWAQVAAYYFGFTETQTYSGGTAVTAFNERAVAALERAGMGIVHAGGENPKYEIAFAEGTAPIVAYSKVYDDPANPNKEFAAVMTCSSADANCPVVFGSDKRIPLLYEDPKDFDGTPFEVAKYDERCLQIATEQFFVWRDVRQRAVNA